MAKKIDLTGQRFGRLVAIKRLKNYQSPKGHPISRWQCVCDCDNKVDVLLSNLQKGNTKSCGCLQKEVATERILQVVKKGNEVLNNTVRKEGTRLDLIQEKDPQFNNSTSKKRGVSYDKSQSRWISYLNFQGKRVHLEYFDNEQDAIDAREEAEEKYFKPILEKYK